MNIKKQNIYLIKELRKKKNFSLSELSDKTGISASTLNRYERGQVDLPLNKLEIIAQALDVSPEYLLGWEWISVNEETTTKGNLGTLILYLSEIGYTVKISRFNNENYYTVVNQNGNELELSEDDFIGIFLLKAKDVIDYLFWKELQFNKLSKTNIPQ